MTHSKSHHTWTLIAATVLTIGCRAGEPASDMGEGPEAIGAFFDAFTADWIRMSPDQAIGTRYLRGEEQAQLERQLTPRTEAWQRERIARAREGLDRLARFDPAGMTESERVSAEVMRWQLETVVAQEPYLRYAFPLQQHSGANVSLPNALTVAHPVATARDAENYVARLALVDDRLREAIAEARAQGERGVLPPRFIVQATIRQMEQFVSRDPADNPLVSTLAQKMEGVDELDADARQRLAAEAARIVEEEVYPAWRAGVDLLREQLPRTTDDAGITRLEGGDEAYAEALRRYTTTDLTADEIHEIGLQEVARIETEMDALFRQIGITEGTIQERTAELRRRLAYPNTEEGRRAIMADIDGMLADALERSAALFDVMPQAPVIAQPYPEFRWPNAAASYSAPPQDGSRPGIFQMPLRPDQLTGFRLRSLVYHETVPGHHFQIALANEDPDLPAFRQLRVLGGISAITEGWALYAERLAGEDGWYEGDVEGRLGQLDSQLFRARRLVVDTGLHTKGWTRQQAIDYGIVPSEVERYVVQPGQACSYMIGQLKIVELRDRAREALGDAFSLSDFHNVVLGLGSVPLAVLESEVDRYIAAAM